MQRQGVPSLEDKGGKEKKGDPVRQAGMGGSFLPQMENFDMALSKVLNDLIMSPNVNILSNNSP